MTFQSFTHAIPLSLGFHSFSPEVSCQAHYCSWGRKHFPLPVVKLSSLSWFVTVSPPRPCGLRPCFHSAAGDSLNFLSLCLRDFHPSGEILSRFLLRYRFRSILLFSLPGRQPPTRWAFSLCGYVLRSVFPLPASLHAPF